MNNTLLHEHIGNNDLGAVDKNIVAINGYGEGAVGQGSQLRAVGEHRGIPDDIGHDMVAENTNKLLHGDVRKGRADGLEGSIVGDEGGQVGRERSTGNARHRKSA